jgi:hypothetical protein
LGKPNARHRLKSYVFIERLEERMVPSVTVGVSVEGMNLTNNSCACQPPDTMEAAGTFHIVHMVNTAIEVFNKDGTVNTAPESTLTFFGNELGNQSDPNVMYDETSGQFVAGILDYSSGSAADQFDWAIGTDSASGVTWTIQTPIASGEGSSFWDYPRIGYNADAWFFEGNMFSGNSFSNVQVITVNKSTGAVISRHDDSSLFTLVPARMHDNTNLAGTELFVESANAGGSTLAVVSETNDTSSSPTFTTQSVSVPAYRSGGAAPQGVPGFDDRILSVAFRTVNGVGNLVADHQISSRPKSRSAPLARFYDINPATLTATNFDAAPSVHGAATFMPSADIDSNGTIGFNYGESAKSEFWSMYVDERSASGVDQGAVKVANGISKSPDSRVGDYSNTTVDPSTAGVFWGANEYQGADFWDTHISSWSVSGLVHQPAVFATLAGTQASGTRTATLATTASTIGSSNEGQLLVSGPAAEANFVAAPKPQSLQQYLLRAAAARAADNFWSAALNEDFLTTRF